jgi:uncharacterized protein YbjT (DUF2867 family)
LGSLVDWCLAILAKFKEAVGKSNGVEKNEKMKVLITGATGNVGLAVIKWLDKLPNNLQINAGVRDVLTDKEKLSGYKIDFVKFDFMDAITYKPALENCDILFLLRPPQISDTKKYFKPIIEIAKEVGVKHIVFLSVQGVEKSSIIPHYKIEKMIVASKIPYTFLRPAYFMQNFLGTLHQDLVVKNRIFLPSGNAKFTLVDVNDIGEVAAKIIINSNLYSNKSYELTNNEKLTFSEMATQLSKGLDKKISFISPNLIQFYLEKRKEKMAFMLIMVMIMLHYFPRFQKEPKNTDCVKTITGNEPIAFAAFIIDNKNKLTQ